MRKKIFITLAVLVLLIVAFAIYIALQPSDFRIERSATIAAPPAEVFAQVNDFHNWEPWSPWAKMDPACKIAFSGTPAGEGAIFHWDGNSDVGVGTMTITQSTPAEKILIRLDFEKPFAGTNVAQFTFRPQGDQTLVTWAMYGQNNFIGRTMCFFMNMDKMVGGEFEKGLASMKSIVETAKKSPPPPVK